MRRIINDYKQTSISTACIHQMLYSLTEVKQPWSDINLLLTTAGERPSYKVQPLLGEKASHPCSTHLKKNMSKSFIISFFLELFAGSGSWLLITMMEGGRSVSCCSCDFQQRVNIFKRPLQHQQQQLLMKRSLWLGNIYERAIRKQRKEEGEKKKSGQFMRFGDGNTVWHKETHNSQITLVLMNKMDARGEKIFGAISFTFFSIS